MIALLRRKEKTLENKYIMKDLPKMLNMIFILIILYKDYKGFI